MFTQLKRALLAMCLLLAPTMCLSEEDPIDEWLQRAIEESERTGGTAIMPRHFATSVEAQGLWDVELNKVYKELMSVLPKTERDMLRTEQRKWLKYRDRRFRDIWDEQFEYSGEGNATVLGTEYHRMNLIKERVLELRRKLSNARPNQHLEPTR